MAKIDYVDLVDDKVRDDAGRITSDDRDAAIDAAVRRYGKDKPRALVEDVVAPGGQSLPLPASWDAEFSRINFIEYPIGNVPMTILGGDAYYLYQSPSGIEIKTVSSFNANDQARINFNTLHLVTDTQDTIPDTDRDAVACYAAAIICEDLAAFYSGSSDSTINADLVDHGDKANRYRTQARNLRKRYFNELGLNEKRNQSAGVVVDWDRNDSQGNDRLQHPGKYR